MDNPKTISIVISSYKYGHLAGHCIDSVISQTRKPDKIYFVDDGVGDCKHLPEIYPEVEYVFRETNLGTVDNFQDMLNRVDTDYVMFLGADNWLRQDTLEKLEEKLNDIVVYDIAIVGEFAEESALKRGAKWDSNGFYYWHRQGSYHGSMLYNVNKARVFGYRSLSKTKQETQEDKYIFNKMVQNGAGVSHVHEPLLYYRRHRENFNKVR